MPTTYDDTLVKCPYYRKNDSNRICCEGLTDKTGINMTFEDSKKRRQYMDNYCKDINNYGRCIICYALNRKYGVNNG
jgi:hypothetical protein